MLLGIWGVAIVRNDSKQMCQVFSEREFFNVKNDVCFKVPFLAALKQC